MIEKTVTRRGNTITIIHRRVVKPDPEAKLKVWLSTLSDGRLVCYYNMQLREVAAFPNAAKRLRLALASEVAAARGLV